jgi:hypothetical protein
MRRWVAPAAALMAALPWTAVIGGSAPGRGPGQTPVDMAIEWLPYARPPITPMAGAPAPAPALRATWCLNTPSGHDTASAEPPTLRADGCLDAPAPSVSEAAPNIWRLHTTDRRLSMTLQRWSALAGWQLVWEAERDFPIEANIELAGSFASALEAVMKSLADSDYPLQALMNTQTRVLRVRRQHESTR